MLELGIALLAWLLGFAVLIETLNSKPRSICRHLTSLGIEVGREGIFFGKHRTKALQIIVGDITLVHPETQTLVPDELHHANSFINGVILRFGCVELVFVDEHLHFPFPFAMLIIHLNRVACQSEKRGNMPKERTNIYITERQKKQLVKRSHEDDLP